MGMETDGMDMRFSKITTAYTVYNKGILKKTGMAFAASVKMDDESIGEKKNGRHLTYKVPSVFLFHVLPFPTNPKSDSKGTGTIFAVRRKRSLEKRK